MHELTKRQARSVEEFERFIDVVGQQPAGHRTDGQIAMLLVDSGIDFGCTVGGAGVDEPEVQTGRTLPPRRQRERRGTVGMIDGVGHFGSGQHGLGYVEEASKGIHDAQPPHRRFPAGQ